MSMASPSINTATSGGSPSERLHLFLKVCSAVQYAHEHHVIHRDLKPNNILITAQGEPRLLDFGIAKLLGWDSSLQSYGCATTTWWGPMTPDYASPEQVCGKTVSKATHLFWTRIVGRH